jgi:[FeFe] hydrogenase H-cluster maturation GTPase HydF
MELAPLGPVVLIDTAGLDDAGDLGELRVERSARVLDRTDLALLVITAGTIPGPEEDDLATRARERAIPILAVASQTDRGGDPAAIESWSRSRGAPFVAVSTRDRAAIEGLTRAIVDAVPKDVSPPPPIGDLVSPGDIVVLVVPIDKAAPKGRLILPQAMTIRDLLDHDAAALVVKERELKHALASLGRKPRMVVTDSQAFLKVAADVPPDVWLTGFSILMARHRGDLARFVAGARALKTLVRGDRVLIAEGCTHHRQADDIGTVQIPRWLRQMVGGELEFGFCSGLTFPADLRSYALVIHCGACTLNRREVLSRQREARAAGVPMTNYGIVLAHVHGILDRALEPFPLARMAWESPEEDARPVHRLERTIG